MDSRRRFGTLGRVDVAWPGYPEPVPDTCLNAENSSGNFYDEWQETNAKIWDQAEKDAKEKLKDPKNTCGKAMSPATKVTWKDCRQELYEPRHDKMIRGLIEKYDCEPGGAGAVDPASGGSGGGSGGSSSSTSSNTWLYALGALGLLGVGGFFLMKKYKPNPLPIAFDGDQRRLYENLVGIAENDGDAYNKRDAKLAVKRAWSELRSIEATTLREDYDVVKSHVERAVEMGWREAA